MDDLVRQKAKRIVDWVDERQSSHHAALGRRIAAAIADYSREQTETVSSRDIAHALAGELLFTIVNYPDPKEDWK